MSRVELKSAPPHVSRTENPGNLGGTWGSLGSAALVVGHRRPAERLSGTHETPHFGAGFGLRDGGISVGQPGRRSSFRCWPMPSWGLRWSRRDRAPSINFWSETRDRLMPRTANRPLPSGRLLPLEVLAFGITAGVMGVLYLASFVNLLTAMLTGSTLVDLRIPLHAAQTHLGDVHRRRCDSGGVASGLGLDGGGRRPECAEPVPVRDSVFVAVSAFPGDRLAVPRAIRAGRV